MKKVSSYTRMRPSVTNREGYEPSWEETPECGEIIELMKTGLSVVKDGELYAILINGRDCMPSRRYSSIEAARAFINRTWSD